MELRLARRDARQRRIDRGGAAVRAAVMRYFLVNDNPMPGASAGGVFIQTRRVLKDGTVKWLDLVVTVERFAISGFKTMCLDGVEYYVEALHVTRLWQLCRVENLTVNALGQVWAPDTNEPKASARALLATLKGAVATIDDREVLVVGPGRNERNECLVVGTACRVMDALNPPAGLILPPWITQYVSKNERHRALVLLRDPEYIGGGHSLPLAGQNGQCFVPMDVPQAQALKMRDFPRFTPPSPGQCPEVVWRDAIGPGRAWSPKPHF